MTLASGVRPMRADAARNRRLLLDAALEAFTRNGVTASLDDVARAAGVGPGTLYRHFPTRDELVLAVIDDGLADIHRLGTALLNDADPVDALHRWLGAYIAQVSMFQGLAQTLASPPPAAAGEQSTCTLARSAGAALVDRACTAGLIRRDIEFDDVLDLAAAIAWVGEQPERDQRQRDRLVRVMLDGLLTR